MLVTAGGKNIYPEEIEDLLNKNEFVLESLVIGKRDKQGNEEPFAVIVPDQDALDARYGTHLDENKRAELFRDIINSVNSRIAQYKRLSGFKLQYEEFPKTSTKKIKRYLYRME